RSDFVNMRGKRSKQYRKLMQSYGMTFGFREPYQFHPRNPITQLTFAILTVDAQMIQDTSRFKMDLLTNLERVLHGKIKPMITQCSIRHLYTLSVPQSEKDPLILLAKNMERRRCNHHELENPLSTLECLKDVVDPKKSGTNRHRYVVASQEEEVRRFCRGVKGVPLVYVKRSVMVLEPMAEGSIGVKVGAERDKFRTGLRAKGTKRKRVGEDDVAPGDESTGGGVARDGSNVDGGKDAEEPAKKKKKARGQKGPNPLSVKKPKKEKEDAESEHVADRAPSGILPGEGLEDGVDIIEEDSEGAQAPSGKRKRRRKHKPGKLEELRQEIAGDNVTSP
ncbi:MAG: hypothetical protein Q9174_007071, partial [Haloplaca sp. 1 TL-2023]